MINFKESDRIVALGRGFLNVYSGNGYEKNIYIDETNENFFRKMF